MATSVIKKEVASGLIADAGSFNFDSLEAAAQRIVENARKQAEAEIAKARAEVDKLRAEVHQQEYEAGRKEGFEKGYKEGTAKGTEEGRKNAETAHLAELRAATSSLHGTLEKMLAEIAAKREHVVEEAERDLLTLAFAIAEKLIRVKIESDPKVVQQTLRAAIDLVLDRSAIDVLVAKEELEAVERFLPELKKQFNDIGAVRVHADESVTRGGTVVRSRRGEVSLRLEDQIEVIAQDLLNMSADKARGSLSKNKEI